MGVTNLSKLLDLIFPPSPKPRCYDSLLVDCQSYLYKAIEHCLETNEKQIFKEICKSTWEKLRKLLTTFINQPNLIIILSFDGEGVPMKWPTQRKRRQVKENSLQAFYRYVLFGNNTLALTIQNYLRDRLKGMMIEYNCEMTIYLSGCNVPGEGEHKIFQMADRLPQCQHPMVISTDHDVFILALLRLNRYQSIQIHRYKVFYYLVPCLKPLIDVSFLFGNDFIPPLVGISPTNVSNILNALKTDGDAPRVISSFLLTMRKHLRFTCVEFVDRLLVLSFWMTYFWMLDYYTLRSFPQQFLTNYLFDAFDRNQLLTALMDEAYSRDVYQEARESYADMETQRVPHAERHVFTDGDLLERLRVFWTEPKNEHCIFLQLTC